jgi:hypothetical protein
MPGKRLAAGGAFVLLLLFLVSVVATKVSGRWRPGEFYSNNMATYHTGSESVTDHNPAPPVEPEFYVVTNTLSKTNALAPVTNSDMRDVFQFRRPHPQNTGTVVKPLEVTVRFGAGQEDDY